MIKKRAIGAAVHTRTLSGRERQFLASRRGNVTVAAGVTRRAPAQPP